MSSPAATTRPAQAARPSSRGAFELHVQSVRASRGLPHLVDSTQAQDTHVIAPPPPYIPGLATLQLSTDEKDEKRDFDLESNITITDIKFETKSHRQTSDDGPEPKTLARAMFLYGFMFPFFWMFGAAILFMDLRYYQTAEEAAEDPRSIDEKKADLAVLRRAEVRWAWRSLYAIISLILILATVLLIWAGATGKFNGFQ